MDGLSNRTAEIAGSMEKLPTKFGELQDAISQRMQMAATPAVAGNMLAIWDSERLAAFLSDASQLGFVAIRALLEATKASRYCDLKILFNSVDEKNKEFAYIYGFLMASTSAGIFVLQYLQGQGMEQGVVKFDKLSEVFQTEVIAEWEKRSISKNPKNVDFLKMYEPRIVASLVDEAKQ